MKQGYIYIYILCTSIKSNLQPRDHRISSTTQPDARALNILLAIIRFTNKRKSLKPRRALAGIEFSFHEREEGIWRGEGGGMNSLWKIASNSHSRAIILGIRQGVSPIVHLFSHKLFSRFISFYPLFVHLPWDEILIACLLVCLYLTDFEADQRIRIFPKTLSTCWQDRFSNIETCSYFTTLSSFHHELTRRL